MSVTLASLRILLGLDSGDVSKGAGRVRGDLKGVQRDANLTRDALKGIGAGFGLGAGLGAFNLAAQATQELTQFIGDSIGKASALQETMSKSAVIFDKDAASVEAWGATAAKAFGQSKQQSIEARASVGNLFKTMGLGQADVLGMSKEIVELASDLASFNNIGTDEALTKLRAGLVGEAEPLRTLGVQLNEATVQAKAFELGLAKTAKELTSADKLTARYAVILEQTKTAQGDFGRTSEGLANQQKTLDGNIADVTASIGGALLPVMTGLVSTINTDVIPAIEGIGDSIKDLTGVVGDVNAQMQPFADILNQIADITGNAGADINNLVTDSFNFSVAAAAANAATTAWLDSTRELGNQLADGTITQDEYNAAVADAHRLYGEAMAGVSDLAAGLGDQRSELDRVTAAWDTHLASTRIAAASIREAGEGAGKTAVSVRDMGDGSREAGEGVRVLASDLRALVAEAAAAPAVFRTAQDAFEAFGTNAPLTSTGNQQLADEFLDRQRRTSDAAADKAARDKAARDKAASAAETAANKAAREAERVAAERAREEAKRHADALADQFDAARDKAREYFDALHEGNVRAIDDIRDRANEELTAQQKAIRGVVSAEQARITAVRAREQENTLRGAVADAETPEDRTSAQRDLNRFLEDQRLSRMSANADIAVGLIDAQKATNDKIAADATNAENDRAAAQRKAFDDEIAALQKNLSRHPEEWARTTSAILKLLHDSVPLFTAVGKEMSDAVFGQVGKGLPSVSATSPNATVPNSSGLGTAAGTTFTLVQHIYVDGVLDHVERGQATLQSVYNPAPPSASGRV